jgi:hypothetical protein
MPRWQTSFDKTGHVQLVRDGLLVRRARLGVSAQTLSDRLGVVVPDHVADLVEVACAIHATDRLASRRHGGGAHADQHRWNRHLRIQVPVRRLDLWLRSEIADSLLNSLNFFTEDDWEFEFVPYGSQKCSPVQFSLFDRIEPTRVGLFSGGLDSLVGLAAHAQSGGGALISLAVGLSSRLLGRQKKLLARANYIRPHGIVPVVFPFRLSQRKPLRSNEEKSQRTRGFLFGSIAASAAWLTGGCEVLVFENGIGAINLPLTQAQLGAQNTRSTHPVGLRKLSNFLSLFLECDMGFALPYLFATKGEACRTISSPVFRDLIRSSISCDSFPLRIPGAEQCGACTSCLLRRQALFEAGLEDSAAYRFDLLDDYKNVPDRHRLPLKDMLWQVHRLVGALRASNSWGALVCEFPALREVAQEIAAGSSLPIDNVQQQLVRLYRRYAEEWTRFPVANLRMSIAA